MSGYEVPVPKEFPDVHGIFFAPRSTVKEGWHIYANRNRWYAQKIGGHTMISDWNLPDLLKKLEELKKLELEEREE